MKDPPDVDVATGEFGLTVVYTVCLSELHFLALAIGFACAAMVIMIIVVILFQHFQKSDGLIK